MVKISENDEKLLKAFLEREAMDYAIHKVNENSIKEFAETRLEKIKTELDKFPKCNRIIVSSHGNAGCVIRQLKFDPADGYFDLSSPELEVNLCTCGILDCWGRVRPSDEKYSEEDEYHDDE